VPEETAVQPRTPLAVTLGSFVAGLRLEDLPPAVVDKTKALVNHALTVAMACSGTERAVAARSAVLGVETLGTRRPKERSGRHAVGRRDARDARRRDVRERGRRRRQQPVRLVSHADAPGRADHPGLPIPEGQYNRLVATIATLETAPSVDTLVSLTLGAQR
jgi:hypothetical protein